MSSFIEVSFYSGQAQSRITMLKWKNDMITHLTESLSKWILKEVLPASNIRELKTVQIRPNSHTSLGPSPPPTLNKRGHRLGEFAVSPPYWVRFLIHFLLHFTLVVVLDYCFWLSWINQGTLKINFLFLWFFHKFEKVKLISFTSCLKLRKCSL